MITELSQLDRSKRYTYADYLTWRFDEMVELIRGKIFPMSPAPNRRHQEISTNLLHSISPFFHRHSCRVYHAPFDVRLPLPPDRQTDDRIDTVVQPDITVVCDMNKLDDRGCKGAPDWIIEILSSNGVVDNDSIGSPATAKKDVTEKFDIYQHAGVREYWIIQPEDETVMVYQLDENGKYVPRRPNPFIAGDTLTVGVFPDLVIDLGEVFPEEEIGKRPS